jgi:hypothetical protein
VQRVLSARLSPRCVSRYCVCVPVSCVVLCNTVRWLLVCVCVRQPLDRWYHVAIDGTVVKSKIPLDAALQARVRTLLTDVDCAAALDSAGKVVPERVACLDIGVSPPVVVYSPGSGEVTTLVSVTTLHCVVIV